MQSIIATLSETQRSQIELPEDHNTLAALSVVNNIFKDEESRLKFALDHIRFLFNRKDWTNENTVTFLRELTKIIERDSNEVLIPEEDNIEVLIPEEDNIEVLIPEEDNADNDSTCDTLDEDMEVPDIDLSFMEDTINRNPAFNFDPSLDILIATKVKHFREAIRKKYILGTDYQIHPDAHCKCTLQGLVCDNVFECGLIHIKRCRYDSSGCTKEDCHFLHKRDMTTSESLANFISSQELYDSIANK